MWTISYGQIYYIIYYGALQAVDYSFNTKLLSNAEPPVRLIGFLSVPIQGSFKNEHASIRKGWNDFRMNSLLLTP